MRAQTAVRRRPLDDFPLIRTQSADELALQAGRHFQVIGIDIRGRDKRINAWLNSYSLGSLSVSCKGYGARLAYAIPEWPLFAQVFLLRGGAATKVDGIELELSRHVSGIASAGSSIMRESTPDFEELTLFIEPGALNRKLIALLGDQPIGRLKFAPTTNYANPAADTVRQMTQLLVERLDNGASAFPPLALAEFEQALMVAFLCGNRHNYSHLLDGQPSEPAPWQVRRAEEYIEANWDQPVTIEALSVVTGSSARSLFHFFKQSRGYSPMAFVKEVRLKRAKRMLEAPTAQTSVTEVAFACGFGNLGHFAKHFRQRFGQLPSELLSRTKGRPERES